MQLDAAVTHAAARGATAAAAEVAELSVALTPGDTIRRRMAAAYFHHLAGDFTRANALYAELGDELPPGLARADVLYLRRPSVARACPSERGCASWRCATRTTTMRGAR